MATLYDTHPREPVGEPRDTWPTTGLHDVRAEPVGGFAGPVAPDDPVGTFANFRRLRRQGTGTFRGDSDCQREGSFADRAALEHLPSAA
jgi:hypothetical protein